MTVEDRYKQSVQEVWSLKEQLAVTSEVSRRAQGTCELVKAKMHETEDKLDEERLLKREISSDLTRQYKSMQTQLEVHVHHLEATVTQLRQELGKLISEMKLNLSYGIRSLVLVNNLIGYEGVLLGNYTAWFPSL
jgi:chromosome segregation ATPase